MNGCPLCIRGDGPLLAEVQAAAGISGKQIRLLPAVEDLDLMRLMKGARFLVWPSQGLYETFGLVAIEAFACGVPVIASGHGVMKEIVEDGRTGLHFTPGDPYDLAAKVRWAWDHPQEMAEMGRSARREYERNYVADRNYEQLSSIYERVLGHSTEPISQVSEV
jgi:glycosyltransferase involved in cell wall biosynthesis